MRAAVYHGAGDIRIEDVPVPEPGAGEFLIEVTAVGICGTDAHEYHSGPHQFPSGSFIPGHEFAGRVVAVGDEVDGFEIGDLVATGAGISCGVCRWCEKGRTNLCATYSTLGLQRPGGLAEYAVVPAGISLEVGSFGLDPVYAALTQPMSIAVHVMRRGRVEPGETALVIGAGGIGSFLTYALSQMGVATQVVDINDERLAVARNLGAVDAVEYPDVVFEVTGNPAGLQQAVEAAGRGARIVLVGLQGSPSEVDLRQVSIQENELIGTNAHVFASDFADAALLLASRAEGWSDVAPMVIPLDDLVELGLVPMIEGRPVAIKTLIDPQSSQ